MEISREKLSAKLDTIPEADRENYVAALRDKGYTWGAGPTRDAVAQPAPEAAQSEGFLSKAANFISEEGVPVGGAMIGGALSAPLAVASGPFAPAVLAGGAAIGAAGARGLQRTYQYAAGLRDIPSTGEAVTDLGAAAASGVMNELGGPIANKVVGALARPVVKVGSQVVRAMSGVPEDAAAKVLRDPSILSRAMPIDDAGKLYREGVGDAAKGSMEAGRSIFGKTYPGPEAAVNTFDEISGSLGAAHPNELLGMRQTMMDTLADTPKTSPKLRKMLSDRIEILDGMLEGRLPNWGGAKQAWREAKIGEEFGSWLPLNKNLSPNVLRTTAAIAAAAKGASEGSMWGALALPLVSPKVWGLGIRAAGTTAQALTSAPAKLTYRVGVQSLADEYASRRNAP